MDKELKAACMESQLLLDGIIIIVTSNMLPSAFYKVAHIIIIIM